jgi:hypothetical protein
MLIEGQMGRPPTERDEEKEMQEDLANDMSFEGKIEREVKKHVKVAENKFNLQLET